MANPSETRKIRAQLDQAVRQREILAYGMSDERAVVIRMRSPLDEATAVLPPESLLEQLRERFGDGFKDQELARPLRFLATPISMGAGIVRNQPTNPGGPEGTLGLPLRNNEGLFFLGAGHVLSNFWKATSKDDPIDWFTAPNQQEQLGKVRDYVPVLPGQPDPLDCGLIAADKDFTSTNTTACGFNVGKNDATVVEDQIVQKCGFRPPGASSAEVIWPSLPAPVIHNGKEYVFANQILVWADPEHPFARPGDSGAVVVTNDSEFVGMLIAGSVADGVFVVTPAKHLKAYWKQFGLTRLP